MIIIKNSLFLFSLIFLSCGKSPEDKSNEQQATINQEGTYSAILLPVNIKVSRQADGLIKLSRYGDELKVTVELKDAPPGIHKQYLHTGSSCPNGDADENHDGYIDEYEASKVIGHIILPFDGDISAQDLGSSDFPNGNYQYERSTSYSLMLSDLHSPDPIPNDFLIKLNERDLILDKKAVSIFGNSPIGEIPIACGILSRVSNTPQDDHWEEGNPPPRNPSPGRRRPRPRPIPEEPGPDVDTEDEYSETWWDRIRQRWRRWRERARDWWERH